MLLLLLLTSAFVLVPWTGAARIIGGREVKPHSRPYMAYLKIQNASDTSSCGGFLIRPDAVLSAAHCLDMEGKVEITVILGAHNVSDQECSQQVIPVRHWVIHPEYSHDALTNDLVLLKLESKAWINKDVQLISIPRYKERVREGAECEVAGWGLTSVTGNMTNVMREMELKVQDGEMCRQVFWHYQCQSTICVGDDSGKKTPYEGDSGGPLVCNQMAYGIASYVHKVFLFPAVYTRISYFEPWIREQLRKFALQELPGSPSSD